MDIISEIKAELEKSHNKLSPEFINRFLNAPNTKVTHTRVTENTRVCVITLATGHDLVGYAQVIDAANDDERIGQSVAYNNAKENIWSVFGSIAKGVM